MHNLIVLVTKNENIFLCFQKELRIFCKISMTQSYCNCGASTHLGHPLPSLLLDRFPPLVLGQGLDGVCVLPGLQFLPNCLHRVGAGRVRVQRRHVHRGDHGAVGEVLQLVEGAQQVIKVSEAFARK